MQVRHFVLPSLTAVGLIAFFYASRSPSGQPLTVENFSPPASAPAATRPLASPQAQSSQPTPVAPVRHEKELAAIEGAKHFPAAFDQAVDDGNEELASDILVRMYMKQSQQPGVAYTFLQPYMDANAFLWRDQILVASYTNSCVEVSHCNRSLLMRHFHDVEPGLYATYASCLDAWTSYYSLTKAATTGDQSVALQTLDQSLNLCLEQNPVPDDDLVRQVKGYLRYLSRSVGKEEATRQAISLASRHRGLPTAAELLADH